MSQEGALIALRPTLAVYRFDGAVSPGIWRALAAVGLLNFGLRAATPAAGNPGYMYYQTNVGWLFYDTGAAYVYADGIGYGTNATRAGIVVGANDNGATFLTSDTQRLWRVVAGAWADVTPTAVTASSRAFAIMVSGA
jgi:hypothetical protein